jgi:hypothetical protein
MERKLRAWLEADELHLQAIGYSHVLDKHSRGEGRWLPRQIIAPDAQKLTGLENVHFIHLLIPNENKISHRAIYK